MMVAPVAPWHAPYAREARHFTEVRVLHRNLDIKLEGLDKYGNFFGSLVHPAGSISAELVKNGLANEVADGKIRDCRGHGGAA